MDEAKIRFQTKILDNKVFRILMTFIDENLFHIESFPHDRFLIEIEQVKNGNKGVLKLETLRYLAKVSFNVK